MNKTIGELDLRCSADCTHAENCSQHERYIEEDDVVPMPSPPLSLIGGEVSCDSYEQANPLKFYKGSKVLMVVDTDDPNYTPPGLPEGTQVVRLGAFDDDEEAFGKLTNWLGPREARHLRRHIAEEREVKDAVQAVRDRHRTQVYCDRCGAVLTVVPEDGLRLCGTCRVEMQAPPEEPSAVADPVVIEGPVDDTSDKSSPVPFDDGDEADAGDIPK